MTPYQTTVMPVNGSPYQQYAQQNTQDPNQYQVQNFDASGYPQTGLLGSEQALQGGLSGALTGLQYGTDQAQGAIQNYGQQGLNSLYGGLNQAQNYGAAQIGQLDQTQAGINQLMNRGLSQITQGGNQAMGLYGQGANALNQARDQVGQYLSQGAGALGSAQSSGLGAINTAYDQGVSALSQFIPSGMNAYNLQGDFLGANGADARSQAFSGYTEGPEQAYLREQGERAVMQNARAAGGVGGNVLKELQRQGIGMAAQDYGNYFNRLAGLSGQGLNAASGVGQLRGAQGSAAGSLISNIGQAQAQLSGQGAGLMGSLGQSQAGLSQGAGDLMASLGLNRANLYGQNASLQSGIGQQIGNVYGSMGQNALGAGQNAAGIQGSMGTNLANLLSGSGNRAADYAYNTGNSMATGRTNAGNQIAAMQGQEGVDLANMLGGSASSIAQLLAGTGDSVNSQQSQLAQLLAGLYGQNAQLAGNQNSSAVQMQQGGYLNDLANVAQGAATAAKAFSDSRLKKNIQKIGVMNGFNIYQWDWIGEHLGHTIGVIAQEVQKVMPSAVTVHNSGYLQVDYSKVIYG